LSEEVFQQSAGKDGIQLPVKGGGSLEALADQLDVCGG
jgi:hypothetical protein